MLLLLFGLILARPDYKVCTDDMKILVDDLFLIVETMENNYFNPDHAPFKLFTASL